jgi:two-component system, cell cycle sensor histidine kinase and response regulator CckA
MKFNIIPLTKNILKSGITDKYSVETIHKVILVNLIGIFCSIFLIILGILAFLKGNIYLGCIDSIVAFFLILSMIYLRITHNVILSCSFSILPSGILFFYLLATGGPSNTGHLWYFTFPLFSAFLLGSRWGAIASVILLFFAVFFFTLNLESTYLFQYSNNFIFRFILSFTLIFLSAFAFEFLREQAVIKANYKNDQLNKTIHKLKLVDMELRKSQEELEKRVSERTAELSTTNIELKNQIKVREIAEHQRQRLEIQLAHSKKMEAIGTLAGGVAHDLNNVLSATVSYPDLLLLDLPEDSPLRLPLLTIQESGVRAAAIVQDLLTLARRGVVVTEVTNMNSIINSYLKSPEFKKLMEIHPDIRIEKYLEPNLLNIMGSSLHLSKTVMNLVNNATEAMVKGGKIAISTESKYIDKPIDGYDDIKEGDYVILTVSDTGVGIPPEDLERIFEPFFTKKKMGRSGTGLGMAVVWGTVKDHDGYIDVQSTSGKGTTFNLYFSITRKSPKSNKTRLSLENYMGNGQSILVIDDIKEQQTIATDILEKLGYSVSSVSSGEEAVIYLKNKTADLLILDMIMEPGLDGLDTYKSIIKSNPNQKAIIASGFSATDRVKAVQEIGAGEYIKKPYTIEKIGVAVKKELKKAIPS